MLLGMEANTYLLTFVIDSKVMAFGESTHNCMRFSNVVLHSHSSFTA